jgi:hypothetical protein
MSCEWLLLTQLSFLFYFVSKSIYRPSSRHLISWWVVLQIPCGALSARCTCVKNLCVQGACALVKVLVMPVRRICMLEMCVHRLVVCNFLELEKKIHWGMCPKQTLNNPRWFTGGWGRDHLGRVRMAKIQAIWACPKSLEFLFLVNFFVHCHFAPLRRKRNCQSTASFWLRKKKERKGKTPKKDSNI